ncbi:MAG TPA: hemerythrin domain-containing protein [Candidatus Nitrosotenuis sp.]|nr:hemerythrin domain-containing protein [Candidatus Nitrosotenuis sp.]
MNLVRRMVDDHEQIDKLLHQSCSMLEAGSRDVAASLLATFAEELRHHIELEEEKIFPRYLERSDKTRQTMAVLSRQHREILERVEALVGLTAGDPGCGELLARLQELQELMEEHVRLEESTLYPFAEELAARQRAQD